MQTAPSSIYPPTILSALEERASAPKILIVDDDPAICATLRDIFASWDMETKSMTNPAKAIDLIGRDFYNLVILDIYMPEINGIDLIPSIREQQPETKIIILTGMASKDTAITALRNGAFDYLEKPIEMDLLYHATRRALVVQQVELDYKNTCDELALSRQDLETHKERLEQINGQLMETNNALSVLAQNIERTRKETERQVVLKTRSLIQPIVDMMRQDTNLSRYHGELQLLGHYLDDLTSGMAYDVKLATTLTASEMRIVSLIRSGLTSEEIANYMNISPSTVKTHRRNIRRKLKINNNDQNLKDFLQSQSVSLNI